MKSLLSIALFTLFALATPAFAAQSTTTISTHGDVSAVTKTSITITSASGALKTFKVNKETKIKLDGEAVAIDKLTFGMDVRVVFLEGDRNDRTETKKATVIDAKTAKAGAATSTPKPAATPAASTTH